MLLSEGAAEATAADAKRMRIVRFFPKLLGKEEELRIQKTGLLLRIYKNSLHCARECARAEHCSGTELNCEIVLYRFVSDDQSLECDLMWLN